MFWFWNSEIVIQKLSQENGTQDVPPTLVEGVAELSLSAEKEDETKGSNYVICSWSL